MDKTIIQKYKGECIMEERGIVYIVRGKNFVKEALLSVHSLRKFCPDIPVTIFSDIEFQSDLVQNVVLIDKGQIRPKVDCIMDTPYKEAIFLDSDTIIDHDITEMFRILDKYEFAIAHDLGRKRKKISKLLPEYKAVPYEFPECNTGVFVFKNNDRVQNLFKKWNEIFYKYYDKFQWDQASFRCALWEVDLNLYILPPEYNIRSKMNREKQDRFHHEFGEEHLKPRIYHMHVDNRINQGTYEVKSVDEALKYCVKHHMPY